MSRTSFTESEVPDLKKNLILAYRKAKADVFYQSADRTKLLKFEENLESNLEELKAAILFGRNADLFKKPRFTGTGTLAPKSLKPVEPTADKSTASAHGNVVFTSPVEQWNQAVDVSAEETMPFSATFRLMSDCGIGLHVLSALWIKLVGDEVEQSLLQKNLFANRIRRTRDKRYNSTSIGTFERYLEGYQSWISEATNAMDKLVKEGKKVASFSTDAKEYFHSIPASILDSQSFHAKFFKFEKGYAFKMHLTECLSESLINWETNTAFQLKLTDTGTDSPKLGLPVGLSCSALLGNAILDDFDRAVLEEVKPTYYGRYVDDISIVLEWHDKFTSPSNFWEWLENRISGLNIDDSSADRKAKKVTYNVFRQISSPGDMDKNADEFSIEFKSDKTKLLVADKHSGKRTIEALKHALKENSSEWRLLMRTPLEAESIGPALITALDESGEPAVRSSQLKTLSSTRSTLSLWLREFEQLERLCDPGTWLDHREEFYKVIEEQILNPLSIMDFSSFIHRVLALALNCGDHHSFKALVNATFKAVSMIEDNSEPSLSPEKLQTTSNHYTIWKQSLYRAIHEIVFAASPSTTSSYQKEAILDEINEAMEYSIQALHYFDDILLTDTDVDFYRLFEHDLALTPFKEALSPVEESTIDFTNWDIQKGKAGNLDQDEIPFIEKILSNTDVFPHIPDITEALTHPFWKQILAQSRVGYLLQETSPNRTALFDAVVFPTRPLSVTQAISWSGYLVPQSSPNKETELNVRITFDELERWVGFLRGFSIKGAISAASSNSNKSQITTHGSVQSEPSDMFGVDLEKHAIRVPRIGSALSKNPKIAVASIFTDSHQITRSIAGKTALDYKSYRALTKLIDDVVSSTPVSSKPDYVLFPELSMPAPWFEWFGNHLAAKHSIGLISGITYLQGTNPNIIHNQIWASLPTSIIGYPISAIYRQDKQRPAHGEEQNLRNFSPTKILEPRVKWKTPPVIWHGDFSFALLICSELTNISHRMSLRGRIDALFVAEKNRDLTTFEALVDSAALDIHAYIAQSNSREFGDSRIRAPRKENHEREIARVRGGINDHFVVGEVEVKKLREFQSWHYKGSDFKPLPDGFREDFDHSREWIPPAQTK